MKDSEYRALAEFRYQIRRFLNLSEQAARGEGLEPQQHQLLLAVKGLPRGLKATVGNLAERMHLQHHSAVELVDRLEARGLIRRRRKEKDRRVVTVRITARGERLLRELSLHHRDLLRSAAPTLVNALKGAIAYADHTGSMGSTSRKARREKPQAAHPASATAS